LIQSYPKERCDLEYQDVSGFYTTAPGTRRYPNPTSVFPLGSCRCPLSRGVQVARPDYSGKASKVFRPLKGHNSPSLYSTDLAGSKGPLPYQPGMPTKSSEVSYLLNREYTSSIDGARATNPDTSTRQTPLASSARSPSPCGPRKVFYALLRDTDKVWNSLSLSGFRAPFGVSSWTRQLA
jgi:hypothetical protein